MYFPSLEILKEHQIDPLIINKLDRWLGLQLPSTYFFLNPLQFAIDMSINTEISIQAFALCTQKSLNIMKVKYRLVCPNCGEYDRVTSNYNFMNESLYNCTQCSAPYNASNFEDFIELFFELLIEPEHNPVSSLIIPKEVNKLLGKSESLRLSNVKDKPSVRRLLFSHYHNQDFD
ncbi:DUF5939 domain-containing protein [Paenibacillus ferrarius]|uniref:DUF5939 domain-containing protein n=1 Tax=Paenibacillus ferrarius TaxID=1469647 RepID=UPI003D2B1840